MGYRGVHGTWDAADLSCGKSTCRTAFSEGEGGAGGMAEVVSTGVYCAKGEGTEDI